MKQNKWFIFFLIFFTLFFFQKNELLQQTVLFSCDLFFTKLFPSLFPMMILSDLFIYFGLPELLCKYFGPFFQKVFSTSPYGVFAFFISCFSGSPSNAYVIKNLYIKHFITEQEASKILSFSFFSNPLFLYTMLSLIFKDHPSSIFKILLIPYFVNLLLGIFSKKNVETSSSFPIQESQNFGTMLSNSIKNAMNTLLFILGTVSFFLILNSFVNPFHIPFISVFLEISQGLNSLISVSFSYKIRELLAIFMISFGGLSIHLQIKGILADTPISYWEFFKGRIKQTLVSLMLLFFL